MKLINQSVYIFYLILFLFSVNVYSAGRTSPLIIDHTCTDITQIPQPWIEEAKSSLHIAYGHTSHGSQLIDGMTGLVAFANGGGKGLSLPENIFAWNNGGTGGALDLHDLAMGGDVGYYPAWVNNTRNYLGAPVAHTGRGSTNPDVNVIIWSWCGQVEEKYEAGTLDSEYLDPMTQLEEDYPGVTFIYMTGHVYIWDDADNKAANKVIYDYCLANNKVLYDFADIEHYDPDGTYFEYTNDDCNYYTASIQLLGNWAIEWQTAHVEDVDWYTCNSAHSQPLNANQKAYAAWWMWTKIAGWDTTAVQDFSPPEVIDPIQDTNFPEDNGAQVIKNDIRTVFSEPDSGDTFTFSYQTESGEISCSLIDYVFSVLPDSNFNGQGNIQIIAENLNGVQSMDTFLVVVTPMNDPPEIVDLPDSLFFNSDSAESLMMSDYARDIDTHESLLKWEFVVNNEALILDYDSSSTMLNLTAPAFNGDITLVCKVLDDSSLSAIDSIIVHVEQSTSIDDMLTNNFPQQYRLYQNFPNPFNPQTTIKYELLKQSNVKIIIYDVLGNAVKTLINETQSAGQSQVNWDGKNYTSQTVSSGIYYYQIVTEEFAAVNKMIFIK